MDARRRGHRSLLQMTAPRVNAVVATSHAERLFWPICRRRLNDWQSGRSSRRARPHRSGRKADGSGRGDIDLVHVDRPHLQTRAVDRYDCYVKCNPPSARTTSPVR